MLTGPVLVTDFQLGSIGTNFGKGPMFCFVLFLNCISYTADWYLL